MSVTFTGGISFSLGPPPIATAGWITGGGSLGI